MTPLGRPVVPPVPTSATRSSGGAASAGGSSLAASSQGRKARARSSPSPSRTSVVSFGSTGAIAATSSSNAGWKISAEQSNKSSSSAFSAAALRGLIGHHTAPDRAMPKTQENAVGSLAERMPTLSPGWTPERRRALATARERSTTSPYDSDFPSSVRQGASGSREGRLSR